MDNNPKHLVSTDRIAEALNETLADVISEFAEEFTGEARCAAESFHRRMMARMDPGASNRLPTISTAIGE